MAIAAAYFAETLDRLGHQVRRLGALDGTRADLIVTTIAPTWRRTVAMASEARARLVYWLHSGGVPDGHGAILAAPPAIEPTPTWSRHVVLPPSSWAAEETTRAPMGAEIVVAGASTAKGGHVAHQVAEIVGGLRWLVLQGRSSAQDRNRWASITDAEVTRGLLEPTEILARARVVFSPTRFEVHPLLLVEAAVRGIPIVCTDLPSTRAAAGDHAIYVPMNAPAGEWAAALRTALELTPPRLRLRPYADVVADALVEMTEGRVAA
jgi:glycosyltransferase involved in cell wall biosynthesis